MRNDYTSADKIESLRQVTNCAVPNSHLRKVLIRCAGDLNLAATELLLNPPPPSVTQGQPEPSAPQPQFPRQPQHQHQPQPQPRHRPQPKLKSTPSPSPHPPNPAPQRQSSPRPPPLQSPNPPRTTTNLPPANRNKLSPNPHAPSAPSPAFYATSQLQPAQSQPAPPVAVDPKEARRNAWRQFYIEKRAQAIRAVGTSKALIDDYIASLWKDMGSAGRKRYVADFVQSQVNTSDQDQQDHNPQTQTQPRPQSQPSAQTRMVHLNSAKAEIVPVDANDSSSFAPHAHSQANGGDGPHDDNTANNPQPNISGLSQRDSADKNEDVEPFIKSKPGPSDARATQSDASHSVPNTSANAKAIESIHKNDGANHVVTNDDDDEATLPPPDAQPAQPNAETDVAMGEVNFSSDQRFQQAVSDAQRAAAPLAPDLSQRARDRSQPQAGVGSYVMDVDVVAATQSPRPLNRVDENIDQTTDVDKEDENFEWPRKLTSRLCRGVILSTSRSNKLRDGDEVILEAPPPQTPSSNRGRRKRGASNNHFSNSANNSQANANATRTRIVRFLKGAREIGRLAPDIGQALGPALQSGYVHAMCKVVSVPTSLRMFAEVILDITVYVEESAFSKGCGDDEMKFEGGYNDGCEDDDDDNDVDDDDDDDDDDKKEDGARNLDSKKKVKEKAHGKSKDTGVDMRRLNVVHLITSLGICEPPQIADADASDLKNTSDKKLQVGEGGAVSESGAEAYYRTVEAIDERDAAAFTPSPFLRCTLREYQRVGVHWMIQRETHGNLARYRTGNGQNDDSSVLTMNPLWKKRLFPDGGVFYMNTSTGGLSLKPPGGSVGGPYGGILADEMGLGKTIQCIATIVHDVQQLRGLKSEDVVSSENVKEEANQLSVNKIEGTQRNDVEDNANRDDEIKREEVNEEGEERLDDEESKSGDANDDDDDTRSTSTPEEEEDIEKVEGERAKSTCKQSSDMDDSDKDCRPVGRVTRASQAKTEARDLRNRRRRKLRSDLRVDDDDENSEDSDEQSDDGDEEWAGGIQQTKEKVDNNDNGDDGDDDDDDEDYAGEEDDDDDDDDLILHRPMKRLRRAPSPKSARKPRKSLTSQMNGTEKRPKVDAKKYLINQMSAKDSKKGGTLIVCPTSLINQWMNELETHVKPSFLRCVPHYGQARGDGRSISLNVADVVVTTYGTLASEMADNGKTAGGKKRNGPLFDLEWRRIVLDEAHTIKSRVTKWAKAAYRIKAERRWCVTGTVIHNHVNDVFSLLHFLKLRPWSSWAFWNRGIVANLEGSDTRSQTNAMCLMRDIISSVTLRRKKNTLDSNGNPIVQLTKKTVDLVSLTASPEERDFYNALHQRTKTKFDAFLAQGKVMKNYGSVLELLLRLRQACDHPFLVFSAAPSKDAQLLKDKDKLYRTFLEGGAGKSSSGTKDSRNKEDGSQNQFVEKVLKEAEAGNLEKSTMCPLCLDVIEDAVAPTECGHPACRACLLASLEHSKRCPVCRVTISSDSILTLPRANGSRFALDLDQRWRPSVKIAELLRELKERNEERWKKGKRIGKSVVFSQFTSMLDLVEFALHREKLMTLRIDGSVSQVKRADVLHRFDRDDELDRSTENVLLVSLRAGGVGLNLVAAAHAVLLDIHWNPQVDAQAQDRIHRHGQRRDVVIRRYVMKDSVEERLVQMQEKKQLIAEGALDAASEEDKKQARISELKLLFSNSSGTL